MHAHWPCVVSSPLCRCSTDYVPYVVRWWWCWDVVGLVMVVMVGIGNGGVSVGVMEVQLSW